ncbi:MAG TPA: hypothetical protein VH475_21495, partial [Tepidisphaeraceae bacterium]
MTRSRLASFARHNAIALLALFVALGGTGYAASKFNGKNIRRHTISGTALKNNTLTGKQIKESKLGTVPNATHAGTADSATSATTAANANALGGTAATSFLQAGCGAGKVNAYVTINGSAASFPNTYTSSAPFIQNAFNCSGQQIQVRRSNMGFYFVKFPGNPGNIAFANVHNCVAQLCVVETEDDVEVAKVTTGNDAGSFLVQVNA